MTKRVMVRWAFKSAKHCTVPITIIFPDTLNETNVTSLEKSICQFYAIQPPLYLVNGLDKDVQVSAFANLRQHPPSTIILTTCPYVSPNGHLTTFRYLYQSGERVEARHLVHVDGDSSVTYMVLNGKRGDVNDPLVSIRRVGYKSRRQNVACSRLSRATPPPYPYTTPKISQMIEANVQDDCLVLKFGQGSVLEPHQLIRHNLTLGFGYVEQHPETFQICEIRLCRPKLPPQFMPLSMSETKLCITHDPEFDIMCIYLTDPKDCIGLLTNCPYANVSACGNDMVLCCDSSNVLHMIELRSASDWVRE